MDGEDDDEGWSFVVSCMVCVGSEAVIDTNGSDFVTSTDSEATVSATGSGVIICLVEVCV